MSPAVHVLKTGRLKYLQGLRLQEQYSSQFNPTRADHFQNILIITEHDPVYTIGIRTRNYNEDDEIRLKKLGAEFYKTNRGGLITFHGPGQLVAYPILNLKQFKPSVRWYVSSLEQTIIDLCTKFRIKANTSGDTGIWIGDKKICAIGIHGKRFITTHGLALNCNTDLSWFEHIVPCGLKGKGVTSISNELRRNVDISEVIPSFIQSFKNIFNCDIIYIKEERVQILNSTNE